MCIAIFITYSDEEEADPKTDGENSSQRSVSTLLLEIPQNAAIEHKKGYMMRKCCYESNHKKSMATPNCFNPDQLTNVANFFSLSY